MSPLTLSYTGLDILFTVYGKTTAVTREITRILQEITYCDCLKVVECSKNPF